MKSNEYAQKVKKLLIQMAIDGKFDGVDMNQFDTTEIEAIYEPVFDVLASIETDCEMAMDGSWDCTTEEGIETGFSAMLEEIDSL